MSSESEPQSLRAAFEAAERDRKQLESSYSSTSDPDYQNSLNKIIKDWERCRSYIDQLSLFSPNETLDDIATGDIQYMLVDFYLAELLQRKTDSDRRTNLLAVRSLFERYLSQLESYDLLSETDKKLLERYNAAPSKFSTASVTDATARRETKIARFRAEKALKEKLQLLQNTTTSLNADESTVRELYLTQLAFAAQQTFSSLETIAMELEILSHAPKPDDNPTQSDDPRLAQRNRDGYSDRVDPSLAEMYRNGKVGPILSSSGRPLQPFTLLDSRQRLQDGVFRPGHNLPTMTIDEYLEEERRRGGIIEGGGPQSGLQPEPDEDNFEKADEETYKARAWDEFTEANPKGAGNTINRG